MKRLLQRHLKIKLGAILDEVLLDADAFALFLRDDLESTARTSARAGHVLAATTAGQLAGRLASDQGAAAALDAEARLATLRAEVATAAAEVETLRAKRASVTARAAALARGSVEGGAGGSSLSLPPAAAAAEEEQVAVSMAPVDTAAGGTLHEGWLRRKATTLPYSWNRAYFVLKPSALMVYDKPGGALKDFYDLNAGIVIAPDGQPTRFSVTASVRRDFQVEGPSAEETEVWLEKLMTEGGRQVRRRTVADAAEGR